MVGALLRFRNIAIYSRPLDHHPVQCIEVRRERRKRLTQSNFRTARELTRDLPGPMDSSGDEAPLGGEETVRFQSDGWVRAQNGAPSLGSQIQGLERPLKGPRTPWAGGGAGSPSPAPERGAPPSHLHEGTPPGKEGRESEAGRIPSQLSPHRRRPIIRRR